MVYSEDPWIQRELAERLPALLKGFAAGGPTASTGPSRLAHGRATCPAGRPCLTSRRRHDELPQGIPRLAAGQVPLEPLRVADQRQPFLHLDWWARRLLEPLDSVRNCLTPPYLSGSPISAIRTLFIHGSS